MKTALQSLDALEALARKMAAMEIGTTALGMISGGLVYAPVEHYREARAIVAELPEPVDPDKKFLIDLLQEVRACWSVPSDDDEWSPDGVALGFALFALRRAREEGVN